MRCLPETSLARALLLAGLVAAALAACSNNDTAIFYYVENEQPVVDYSLNNESTILGMTRANDYYFASLGGSIWQRSAIAPDHTWHRVSVPSHTDYCGPLAPFSGDGRIYVTLLVGSSWRLYSIDPTVLPFALVQVTTNLGGIAGKQVTGLFEAGGRLFAATMEGETSYSLYSTSSPGAATFDPTGISDMRKPITQVAFDGAVYYAAAATHLLRGDAAAATMSEDVTPVGAGGAVITGVYYTSGFGGKYYAATDEGELFESAAVVDGTSWTGTGEIDVSGVTVRFTRISEVAGPGGNIMIGSMEHGPFQLGVSGAVGSNDRLVDTTDSELYNGDVRDFYYDTAAVPPLFFAMTAGSGLWHASYTAPDFSEWGRE